VVVAMMAPNGLPASTSWSIRLMAISTPIWSANVVELAVKPVDISASFSATHAQIGLK